MTVSLAPSLTRIRTHRTIHYLIPTIDTIVSFFLTLTYLYIVYRLPFKQRGPNKLRLRSVLPIDDGLPMTFKRGQDVHKDDTTPNVY